MKVILTSIKDELGQFSVPIPVCINQEEQKDATIKRFFRQYVEENPMMSKNPEDFSIWEVGEFDTLTAKVTEIQYPKLIERGQMRKNGNKEE